MAACSLLGASTAEDDGHGGVSGLALPLAPLAPPARAPAGRYRPLPPGDGAGARRWPPARLSPASRLPPGDIARPPARVGTSLTDINSYSYLEMNTVEFNLEEALNTVLMQGMSLSKEKQISLDRDWPVEVSSMYLYGDNLRLQQVLADYLACTLQFTQPAEGPIVLQVIPRKEKIGSGMQIAHLEFRLVHPAPGVPETLIQEMFRHGPGVSREGLGLHISQKLVKTMSGTVQYLREAESSSFIVLVEFPVAQLNSKRPRPSTSKSIF